MKINDDTSHTNNGYKSSAMIAFWAIVLMMVIGLAALVISYAGATGAKQQPHGTYRILVENLQTNHCHEGLMASKDSVKAFLAREFDESKGSINFFITYRK